MMNTELAHHGVLGMRWGVRRYQNKGYEKELKKEMASYYSGQYKRLQPIDEKIGSRIDHLVSSKKSLQQLKKKWTGDGGEFCHEVLKRTGDKILKDLNEEYYKVYKDTEDAHNRRVEDLRKKWRIPNNYRLKE